MDEQWTEISLAYLPALARVGGILACAPLLSASAVPVRVRALFAVALTVGLMPTIGTPAALPDSVGGAVVGVGGELLIGAAIGLALNLVFAAAQWAGEIIAQQMGLGLAESFDPTAGTSMPVLSNAYALLATVVFLGINGHHALVRGVEASFRSLPVLGAVSGASATDLFVRLLASATQFALQLAAPVFVTLLVVDLAIGMVGRTVPQVGAMTAGVALRASVGLVVLIACVALSATLLQGATLNWMQVVQSAVTGLGGGR